jgi:hypothetical protein
MNKFFILFFIVFLVNSKLEAQKASTEKLDYSFGFREFVLKTPKQKYISYEMKKSNFYRLPDIIEVYSLPYNLAIGNTKIEEVHLFFLGNQLVRVTALLKDSLNLSYLQKSFGEGSPPEEKSVQLDKKLMDDISNGTIGFAYSPLWLWKAETVRFEQKWIYLCDHGSCVKKMCLDLYLVDFQELMTSILN